VHSSGCVGNSQEKKPAGFDKPNWTGGFDGFHGVSPDLFGEKKKVLSLAEFDFECSKSQAKRRKFFVFVCFFAWNKHFVLCVY